PPPAKNKGAAKPKRKRKPKPSDQHRAERNRLEDEQKRIARTAFPVYASRITVLEHRRKNGQVAPEQIEGLPGFGSDDYLLKRYSAIGIRATAAISVLNLMHLNGASWDALWSKASNLASPTYSDTFGHHLLPLWEFLLLRLESRDFVLGSVTDRMPALRKAREPGSEKVNAAVKFSQLVLNFSEPDARTFFEDAVKLAQEIDREAINQIGVLDALTTHFASWNEDARRIAAPTSVNVLTDVAVRLRNEDHFPWDECVTLLVKLHPPTALAAVSRWSDQGIREHEKNLEHFLGEAQRLEAISPELATSLLALIPYVPNDVRLSVVARLKTVDPALAQKILELFAEEILLLEEPTSIAWQADSL